MTKKLTLFCLTLSAISFFSATAQVVPPEARAIATRVVSKAAQRKTRSRAEDHRNNIEDHASGHDANSESREDHANNRQDHRNNR